MDALSKPWYSFEGKTIWVIGGAGYLGGPITEALDRQCRRVICSDLEGRAQAFVEERKLERTVPDNLDAYDTSKLPQATERVLSEHGTPDGLVFLVTASSRGKRLEELSVETFRQTIDQALTPAFSVCRAVGERMKARGGGSVVLFSSMYGVVPPDPRIYQWASKPNPIDYGANKAALLQMMRYFAVHYGPAAVRFNAVTPGPFPHPATQQTEPDFIKELNKKNPLGRIGRRDEMVGPTLFLLSDSASYVTGQNLIVDGGWTVW